MVFLAPMVVIAVLVAVRLLVPAVRRARTVFELRQDWWPGFESEFRAYASQAWEAAREAERSP